MIDMKKDDVHVEGKWEFDAPVADCFDDMLHRSIPQYEIMRKAIKLLCKNKSGKILDLGCANGLNLIPFQNDNKYQCTGIDVSEPMIKKAKERFNNVDNIEILNRDIVKENFGTNSFDIIMSVLTIQFTPIENRQQILQNIYDALNRNRMFIFVEKVLGSCNPINNLLVDCYYELKNENGYSKEQIEEKRKSLAGVLVPVTSEWNKELLKQAGFTKIETFWRMLNFEGYIAIKG
jgi:tRNA (cmo5U34)-methyltransferase